MKKKIRINTENTAELVRNQLAKLRTKQPVTLAMVPSSKKDHDPYPIKMGANNAVYCACNGFKYRNECRHMERFRAEVKVQILK